MYVSKKYDIEKVNAAKAGGILLGAYKSFYNVYNVTMVLEASGIEVLDEYTRNPNVTDNMINSRVVRIPLINIFNEAQYIGHIN